MVSRLKSSSSLIPRAFSISSLERIEGGERDTAWGLSESLRNETPLGAGTDAGLSIELGFMGSVAGLSVKLGFVGSAAGLSVKLSSNSNLSTELGCVVPEASLSADCKLID